MHDSNLNNTFSYRHGRWRSFVLEQRSIRFVFVEALTLSSRARLDLVLVFVGTAKSPLLVVLVSLHAGNAYSSASSPVRHCQSLSSVR